MAQIHFAYDNRELIEMLRQRGRLLMQGKYKEHSVISSQIEKLVEEKKEDFSRPVVAFVIFETQEGQERCFEEFLTTKNMIG